MKISEIQALAVQAETMYREHPEMKNEEILRALGIDPSNVYQELEMSSRFVDTHQDTSISNMAVNLHSHTFYEILSIRSNSGTEYLVEGRRYKLQTGDIIIVPPGVSHRPLLPDTLSEPYKRDVLWISIEFMKELLKHFPEAEPYPYTETRLLRTAGTRWTYLLDMIHWGVRESQEKKSGWELAVCANTVYLLVHLRRAISDKAVGTMKAEKKELMDKVLDHVEKHYAEKLTLAEVAGKLYVSESTISQIFRKKMGVSFYRWVTQRRLIAAKILIEEGKSMESVAELVGFADYSSFFRAFKQEFGISPRQYRKMQ